jgi:hypothetical protein
MVPHQQVIAGDSPSALGVPPDFAACASLYRRLRRVEAQHLELMARHNLLDEWNTQVRETVLNARACVEEARSARQEFRAHIRRFVQAARSKREPLLNVLRQLRSMLHALVHAGAFDDDNGWFETEVLEWAIEDYDISIS